MKLFQVRRENPKAWKKCLAREPENDDDREGEGDVWELKPELSYVKNDENLTEVDPTEMIESHRYGSELITIQGGLKQNFLNINVTL